VIALDASAMIAALKTADAHHDAASAILGLGAEYVAHTVTLAEVLAGGVRIGRAAEMHETLVELGVVEVGRVEDEAIRLARLRVETSLKMPDCCALLVAESQEASLATFDGRLARVARSRGVDVVGGTSDGGR
jgi:predicted nucleic acid-binding protein